MFETKDFTENISVDAEFPYEDYIRLPEVPCQRNTEERIKNARHLKYLRSEQCIVHLAKLTKESNIRGKKYPKNMVFRVDGNTRAMAWETGKSDYIPEKLIAITYEYETLDEIKECYNTFDSTEATEKNQQKLFGVITGFYNYQPKSEKLIQGAILSGLNKACHFMWPLRWNQSGVRTDQLEGMVGCWIGEIKALDELMTNKKVWNQPFICAALMSLRHYGTNNQNLLHAWNLITSQKCNLMSDERDGVSHIVYEWMNGKFFKDVTICKDTKWENMNRTVSYILYWLDKYMEDEKLVKVGNGWDRVAFEYKDRIPQDKLLNSVFSIES